MRAAAPRTIVLLLVALVAGATGRTQAQHQEAPGDPPAPRDPDASASTRSRAVGGTQVNVDATGGNIPGDAANEPSMAVDPRNPARIAVGWRQFDSVTSNFRQAGFAYSTNGGQSFTFAGRLTAGTFRSDPVMASGPDGTFYYYSLSGAQNFACDVFRSQDGGATWGGPIPAYGGDKAWMTVDRTGGPGNGHVYVAWSTEAGCCGDATFTRSVDGGLTYMPPVAIPGHPIFGTLAVDPAGILYVAGAPSTNFGAFIVARSPNAREASATPGFDLATTVSLGGPMVLGASPNPDGLLGQAWVATGPQGQVYLLCSVDPPGDDPLDVMFSRSLDGGVTWSAPLRVNDDAGASFQWFGTMSVAPGGRIDVVWNNTGVDPSGRLSELRYAASVDGGASFGPSRGLAPPFNHGVGYPNQRKLGDYYHMLSDDAGASLAYAATYNGEQDVYFLRVGPGSGGIDADIDGDGRVDGWDLVLLGLAFGTSAGDPRFNPEADIDGNGIVDGGDLALLVSRFGTHA